MSMEKNKVKRAPKRGIYNSEEIYAILDKSYLCHISFIHKDYPVSIPTMYGRKGDAIYIHGASVSRLVIELEKGLPMSLSVAEVQGLVLARSAFHHSLNYESVVIFGKGVLVQDEEKLMALKAISDQAVPGRWEEARQPNAKELKATKVIKIQIEEASAKRRTGPPIDDKADYELDIWAGVVPLEKQYKKAIPDDLLNEGIGEPKSVNQLIMVKN